MYRWIDKVLVAGWVLPTFWLHQGETSHKIAETLLTYSPLNFSHKQNIYTQDITITHFHGNPLAVQKISSKREEEEKKTHRQMYRWIDKVLVVGWFLPTFWLYQGETSHKIAETLLTYSPLNFFTQVEYIYIHKT